jgi:uncharacterized RDD family membrane protein YckC
VEIIRPYLITRRILAYLADIVLLFAVLAPTALLIESLTGLVPKTPSQVWIATVLSFSIPAWLYFILSDHSPAGATFGKRWFKVRVVTGSGGSPSLSQALARNAVKLLPWEMAHIFGFALAEAVGPTVQSAGLIAANALTLAYLVVMLGTRGRKSIHDFLVGTEVTF